MWRAPGRLALWAESGRAPWDPALPSDDGSHPFSCSGQELQALLTATTPAVRWLAAAARPGTTALRLPTANGQPVPSPELTGPAAGPDPRDVRLQAWRVETLELGPGPAAQLLGELYDPYPWRAMLLAEAPGHEEGADGPAPPRPWETELHFGAALRWLIAVHDHAWHAVRTGQVVPSLVDEPDEAGSRPHARWRPLPDAPAQARLAALAAAAPPSALAEAGPGSHGPGSDGPAALVRDAVAALVDAEVRVGLEGEAPLLAPGRERSPSPASGAARAWVRALTSADAEVRGADAAALIDLDRRLTRWHRSTARPPGDVQLAFRLAEPVGASPYDPMGWNTDEHWELEFVVRSVAEPALTVDARRLWAGGDALAALRRATPAVEEVVLDELDRAARCWPPLAQALVDARPDALPLDRAGATAFLAEGAPALSDAGFDVLLPSWWRRRAGVGLQLTARAAAGGPAADPGTVQTPSLLDRDAVVAFAWQAAVGEAALTVDELARLAAATVPLVRLRGQWLVADQGQIRAALEFLRREGTGTTTVGELLRTQLAPEPSAGGLPVVGVEAEGALGELLAGRAPVPDPADLPAGFDVAFGTVLRPYQRRGVAWLRTLERLGLGGVLADDMGLGKTVQTLALLVAERLTLDRTAAPATLLVCPLSLVGNWQRETERFAPGLRVHVHHGPRRHDLDLADAARTQDLVLTTYAVAHRDADRLRGAGWHRLVVDEAHQVKNRSAAQSRAVRSIPARHRLALTGTPVENRLADLHAVLDLAVPGLLGSPEDFRERYAVPIERHADERASTELRRRTRPLLLRRLKTDPGVAADLPEKIETTVRCSLTVEQAALYQAVVSDVLRRVEGRRGIERRGVVLASLSKLKQVCDHPALFLRDGSRIADRSGKIARLEEILDEVLAARERALCFTQFARFGALLQPWLAQRLDTDVLFLHGGLPRTERERLVARFQEDARAGVFLLSLKAGGTGLNLTGANHVVHLDRWWNPAVEDQATDRAFRIGQRRDVQVRRLVCAGTVEERIDEIIAGKRALADLAVTPGEGWLADAPSEVLAGLIELDRDLAVEDDDE